MFCLLLYSDYLIFQLLLFTPLDPTVLTISLIVECHQLDAVQPEEQRVGVCGVDPRGCWVGPEQLAHGVMDQLLRVTAAQALGGVLVDRRDVVTLGRADDSAEGGGRGEDRGCLLLLPAQPLSATLRTGTEKCSQCPKTCV